MTNDLKNLFGELRTIPSGLGCMDISCEGCEWEDKERERLEKEIINKVLDLVKKEVEKKLEYDLTKCLTEKELLTIINNLRV